MSLKITNSDPASANVLPLPVNTRLLAGSVFALNILSNSEAK